MGANTLMLQGTSSDVGKSVLAAGLCRIYARRGFKVAPFKAQNMALNSYVTLDGKEMGRAQVSQARAAGIEPSVDMNPLLLKPEGNSRSQIVLMGQPVRVMSARDYYKIKSELWYTVKESLERLRSSFDLLIIEGAGSPAEINLKKDDIVNMRVAMYLNSPVLLIGDIDRGGVFASLYGTLALLEKEERELVRGFLINKFRGDISLLEPGLDMIADLTGKKTLGVIPYMADHGIAQEDSVYLENNSVLSKGSIDIAVIKYPRTSNYDDIDPLMMEPDIGIRFISSPEELGNPDAVILPGSKSTVSDLQWMRNSGIEKSIFKLRDRGVPVVGICGGYQMMGYLIKDKSSVESSITEVQGMGLLPVETSFEGIKRTVRVDAVVSDCEHRGFLSKLSGVEVSGYEIHMGNSKVSGRSLFLLEDGRTDGAIDEKGLSWGTYLHGVFDLPSFRRGWLRSLGWLEDGSGESLSEYRDRAFDRLADVMEESMNMTELDEIIGV